MITGTEILKTVGIDIPEVIHTILETWNLISSRIGAGGLNYRISRNVNILVTQDMEEMIISMYDKRDDYK